MNDSIPSKMPGKVSVGLPLQYRDHPLLNAGPYFTIPEPLLKKVVELVGKENFDSKLLELEFALSSLCKDHDSRIGFWGYKPIHFLLLRLKNKPTNDKGLKRAAKLWDMSEDEVRKSLLLADPRLDWTVDVRRGYCGWLITNRVFLDEHREIFNDWKEEIAQGGIPIMGPVVRNAQEFPGAERGEGKMEHFIREYEKFFIRWRLEGMLAPFVPQPMGTHLPVSDLRHVLGHMRSGGSTFYIPDIYPVPSRDKLREIMEEALRDSTPPEHLAEWFEIVHSENAAKNQIPRYARIFEVQHYMRAFYARHATALHRKKSSLKIALSEYLNVSEDSIERDFRLIASRLKKDWYLPEA